MNQEIKDFVIDIYSTRKDLKMTEKAEMVNNKFGTNYDESTFRKYYKAFTEGKTTVINADEEMNRIVQAEERLLIQQKKVALLKRSVHKNAREISMARIIESQLKKPTDYKIPNFKDIKIDTNTSIEYVISDIHYTGEKDNEHTWEIFNTIIRDYTENHQGEKINLIFLGDDIEGNLHDSQLLENETMVIQQTIDFINLLEACIINVQEKCKTHINIFFVCESNHGQVRYKGTQRGMFPKEDVGYIIFDRLKRIAEYNNWLTVKGGSIIETDDCYMMHGDKPYMRTKAKLLAHFGQKKNIYMGHFHEMKLTGIANDNYVIVFPTCKKNYYHYEEENGYSQNTPRIAKVRKDINKKIKAVEIFSIKIGK